MLRNGSKPRPIGRPPAGARDGERVKDYPQLSIRIPAEIKAKVQAMSVVSARPQWRIVTEAIECYLRTRSEREQRKVDELAARHRSSGQHESPTR